MNHPPPARKRKTQLPAALVWAVGIIAVLPFLLSLAGVDFPTGSVDTSRLTLRTSQEGVAALRYPSPGNVTHTLLEWSGFSIVFFTVLAAFVHYDMQHEVTTLVIGMILFAVGMLDTLHLLVANRWLGVAVDRLNFMPFTWAFGRLVTALFIPVGVTICLTTPCRRWQPKPATVLLIGAGIGVLACGFIYGSASTRLPQTMFPHAIVKHPYDLVPLVCFLVAGVSVFPRLYRQTPRIYVHALIISTLASVVMELHMVFGSAALFDQHSHMAHFLKIIAHLVLLSGFVLDGVSLYRDKEISLQRSTETRQKEMVRSAQLERTNAELVRRNAELDEFAYVVSHDLQEPVRKLRAFSTQLQKDLGTDVPARASQDIDFIVDAATRMQALIQDLLRLARAGKTALACDWLPLDTCVNQALAALAGRVRETGATITRDPLPVVWGDARLLIQLYQNLLDNALKFVRQGRPVIRFTAERHTEGWILGVQDRGIGLHPEDAERIFAPFTRLHTRTAYAGTGIGLAICQKVVERHGGRIWVESQPDKGAHFKFILNTTPPASVRYSAPTEQSSLFLDHDPRQSAASTARSRSGSRLQG